MATIILHFHEVYMTIIVWCYLLYYTSMLFWIGSSVCSWYACVERVQGGMMGSALRDKRCECLHPRGWKMLYEWQMSQNWMFLAARAIHRAFNQWNVRILKRLEPHVKDLPIECACVCVVHILEKGERGEKGRLKEKRKRVAVYNRVVCYIVSLVGCRRG